MYYLQTTSINQAKDSSPKGSDLKAKEKLHSIETIGRHKRRHRDISAFDLRRQPWMKNFTLSSQDLIWGSCDPIEEQFMSISSVMTASSISLNLPKESPPSPVIATRSLLSEDTTPKPTKSQERHGHAFPRFRQDLIMDREDVDLKMLELQTTALRRSSSLSDSSPPASPREWLALCSRMMNQTDHDTAFSCELETAKRGGYVRVSDYQDQQQQQQQQQGTIVPKQGGGAPPTNAGGTQFHPSLHTKTYEYSIDELGSKVRIHDQERIYMAMQNGTATLVQCVGCSRHLLATRDIELVYCPACDTITPIEIGCLPDSSSCCDNVARRQQQETESHRASRTMKEG